MDGVKGTADYPSVGEGVIPISTLHTSLFNASWRAVSRVLPTDRRTVDWMIRRHYLKHWPGVVVCTLGLFVAGQALGVLVFALPPRETAKRYGGITWELARLWVDDCVPQNGETWFVAAAIRHIRKTRPEVQTLVSYADPSVGHQGGIYRAANWTADGRTDQERKTPRFDYIDERTGKRYSRRKHVPLDAVLGRIARVSKPRFTYRLHPVGTPLAMH